MSFPRLTFLYPHLFKPARVSEPGFGLKSLHAGPKQVRRAARAGFSSTRRSRQETYAQRYGSAAEPPPPSDVPSKSSEDKTLAGAIEKEVNPPPKQEEKRADHPEGKEAEKSAAELKKATEIRLDDAFATTLQDPSERAIDLVAAQSNSKQETEASPKEAQSTRPTNPLATVLEMPAPTADTLEQHRGPHLQAPPYVHHFDTFTLVKNLEAGGFTQDQSVTIMKAVRSLLALNLDVAREGLVSKSDVENEIYLFRAACSELRTEILNARKASSTKQHTQLSHLQHTSDILSQRVSQESLALKDDLKGMLNDRRMAVRMQQQSREGEISELNYKISVALNSDSKSEVEGLRWVLTRRAAMAIATMAVLILGSLRYSSYKIHEREMESRRGVGVSSGGGAGYTVQSRETGTQTAGGEALSAKGGESVGYVSLG